MLKKGIINCLQPNTVCAINLLHPNSTGAGKQGTCAPPLPVKWGQALVKLHAMPLGAVFFF
jgi:hypothetical protein